MIGIGGGRLNSPSRWIGRSMPNDPLAKLPAFLRKHEYGIQCNPALFLQTSNCVKKTLEDLAEIGDILGKFRG